MKEKSKTCPFKKIGLCLDEPMHVCLVAPGMKQMVMPDEVNHAPDKISSYFLCHLGTYLLKKRVQLE